MFKCGAVAGLDQEVAALVETQESPLAQAIGGFDPNVVLGFMSPEEPGVVHRAKLEVEDEVVGPAIIVDYSGTTLLPSGWTLEVVPTGLLVLRRER